MRARRERLARVTIRPDTHAGLWMDRYLSDQTGEGGDDDKAKGAKARLIRDLSRTVTVPRGYREMLTRLQSSFAGREVTLLKVTTLGRTVVGLGARGSLEAGLHMDHTWGVPVIPGSALKGLASATAHHLARDDAWHKPTTPRTEGEEPNDHEALFGTNDEQGAVLFHDAWWSPRDESFPVDPDTMTVHHPDYYQKKQGPPSDTDSPTPVPFATVNGDFLVMLEGSEPWRNVAVEILLKGLEELGIGAKTNAGYGRMAPARQERGHQERGGQERDDQERPAVVDPEAQAIEEAQRAGQRLTPGNAAAAVPQQLNRLQGAARREFARAAVAKLKRKWVAARPSSQTWAAELLAAAEGAE